MVLFAVRIYAQSHTKKSANEKYIHYQKVLDKEWGGAGILTNSCWEMEMGTAFPEAIWQYRSTFGMCIPFGPAIVLLQIIVQIFLSV